MRGRFVHLLIYLERKRKPSKVSLYFMALYWGDHLERKGADVVKRIFMYVRVSTEEQAIHGLSIEAQTETLETWVRAQGYEAAGTYVDAGISARKPASKRPELQRLLSDVRAGLGDLIVFTKLDRWFRNIAEYYKVQEILEKYHVDWKTIQEDYDTSTASGRLKINIMLSVAQDEADRTSERIKAVYEMKRQKLEPLSGNAPTGYKIDGKRLIKDPSMEAAISGFFQDFLATGSVSRSLQKLSDNFGVKLSYQLAGKMLSSPAYYGVWYGVNGMTPPYITQRQYDTIQRMRKRTVRKSKRDRIYLFSGLIVCGHCGRRMSGKINAKAANPCYSCPSHYGKYAGCENSVNYNERKLADYLLDRIDIKMQECRVAAEKAEVIHKEKDYKSEIAAVKRRRSRLKELYLAELIELAEYQADYTSLTAKLEELRQKEQPPQKINLEALLGNGWREAYEEVDRETKQKFWRILIREICIYPDRHIDFELNI